MDEILKLLPSLSKDQLRELSDEIEDILYPVSIKPDGSWVAVTPDMLKDSLTVKWDG